MSRPSKQIEPSSGLVSRRMQRLRVDLPEPDSPTRPNAAPRWMSTETPSTARNWPPSRVRNDFTTSRTDTRGPSAIDDSLRQPGGLLPAVPPGSIVREGPDAAGLRHADSRPADTMQLNLPGGTGLVRVRTP